MKKIQILSVVVFGALCFCSCKKNYTCTCEVNLQEYIYNYNQQTKGESKTACDALNKAAKLADTTGASSCILSKD